MNGWATGLIVVGLGLGALLWLICYAIYLKNRDQYSPRRRSDWATVGKDTKNAWLK